MDINDSVRATSSHKRDADPEILRVVRDALDRLRFGSIHLTIHEGKLVQIDVTEKTRLPA
mgnify:CR=1 FL=1